MHKGTRIHREILRVLVCAALSRCVVPQAALCAPQCETGPNIAGVVEQRVPVPPLQGQTVQAASRKLQEFRLRLGKVLPSNGNGVVFRQSLEANRCVPLSTPVDVWIENVAPPPAVEVPDLRGQSSLGATLLLTIRGLKYGGSSKEQSGEVAPGKIFSQQPAAGSMVPKGTTVVVTLAEPVTVPPPTPYRPSPPQETLTLKSNLYGPAIPGELVTFTGVAQGSAHTIQFRFNFGDGQESSSSDSPLARHSYAQDGNYIVTVTAILDGGASQLTASTDIGVHEAPQVISLGVSPTPVYEKQQAMFTAQVYPPEPAPSRYVFQFGDKSELASQTPSVSYAYQQSKTYHPFVTILTAHGHKASSQPISLIVVPPGMSTWKIVLIAAGLLLSASVLGVAGYKILQRIVTRGISYNLRPGEVMVRLQSPDGRLKEDEIQFHTTHFAGVITVPIHTLVVRSVEVQK